jgi:hypothetical protein
MEKVELTERMYQLAIDEVMYKRMSYREAAEEFMVDQAVLVHRVEEKWRALCEQQRRGTYKVS